MKNSLEKILWGVLLVVFGAVLAGRALDLFEFNLFFSGWWTFFIIIPSAISLISGNNISSSIGGLAIGILLLMAQSGIVDWQDFGKLLVALIFVMIGCSFLFPGDKNRKREDRKEYKQSKETNQSYQHSKDYETKWSQTQSNDYEDVEYQANSSSEEMPKENASTENNSYQEKENEHISNNLHTYQKNYKEDKNSQTNRFRQYTGFLSSQKDQYVDEVFGGAVVNAILGGVELDLRNAVFLNDTIIDITCIMGGVDIFVPTNMKVVVNCTPIMGGVDCYVKNHHNQTQNQYTLFIKGTCLMGGVEIK